MAGAVLAATSLVAVTPVAQRAFKLPTLSIETQLVDAVDSLLNVPINLLTDIANIPYNEVGALNSLAGSNFLGGNWWVPSATNLWGIDTGDPTKVALLTNLFAPFPAFNQGLGGLQYQIAGFLAAQLPVSDSCDAETCFPMTPPEVITGSTSWDRAIGFINALSGQGSGENFGLFQNWFQVPIQDLINGYTFDDATNPSGPAYADPAFGFGGGTNPFEGATIGDNDAMPWNGHTYFLNLFQPFQNYWEHLLEDPATDGDIPGTGIQIPTIDEFGRALQSITASTIAAFNPYTAGSPACPALCDIPESLTTRALVDMLDPDDSNPMIQAWLAGFDPGAEFPNNNATPDQVSAAIALLQTGIFNLTPDQLDGVIGQLEELSPALPALAVNAGFITDPGYLAFLADPESGFAPVYGGWNPALVLPDILQLFGIDTGSSGVSELVDPAFDLSALFGGFDPASLDWSALFGGFDPAAMSADFATMLEDLTSAWATDLATSLLNVF
ncbi:MAG TPA: hypothetical protein VGG53_18415 [Mycobacterium sp.]|uniref:hypothetical protein n=1 Tax=Mycobacterium sp. TaxID=1785 RepID=UPI002F411044